MKAVLSFLERYVQWVAVLLGVLWLLYVGYSYWAVNPVSVVMAPGKPAKSAGEVDQEIQKSPSFGVLDKAVRDELPTAKPVRPATQSSQVLAAFESELMLSKTEIASAAPFNGPGRKVSTGTKVEKEKPGEKPLLPNLDGIASIKSAPKTALVVVSVPSPILPVMLQPTGDGAAPAPDGATPAAPAPAVVEKEDWRADVRVSAVVDINKFATAWKDAHLPADPVAYNTDFLKVQLIRQEVLGDAYGPEEVIRDAAVRSLPAWPVSPGLEAAYLNWVREHAADIINPTFYQIKEGADATAQAQATAFDPNNPPTDRPLTPEEQKMVNDARRAKQKEEADARKAAAAAAKAAKGGASRTPSKLVIPKDVDEREGSSSVRGWFATTPPAGAPAAGSATPLAGDAKAINAAPAGGGTPAPDAAGGNLPVPTAKFNPTGMTNDIEVWAHDETAIPGHTYRYKVRIFIKNPLFNTDNVAANPDDAKKFSLQTETEWSQPVTVPAKEYFFLAAVPQLMANPPSVKVDYYWWDMGKWRYKPLKLSAGDAVGPTTWSVCDLRTDGRVLIVSDAGQTQTRNFAIDQKQPSYGQLKQQATKGDAAVPAPVGAAQ